MPLAPIASDARCNVCRLQRFGTEAATVTVVERRLDDVVRKVKARFPHSIEVEKFFICDLATPVVNSDESKLPEPAWEHQRALLTCMSRRNSDPFFAY